MSEYKFVCNSAPLRAVVKTARRVAVSKATVLVTGETGAGKEVLARLIHEASGRKGEFVPVNCASIPKELFEAEMFGTCKGSYSGSVKDTVGLVKAAESGTLFLDEVGDLDEKHQAKILRLLENHEYRVVGDTKLHLSTARIVASTNLDVHQMQIEGKYRSDLIYRLSQFHLVVPPLRDHTHDIHELVEVFLKASAEDLESKVPTIEPGVMEVLMSHSWPGNVRELKHVVYRLALFADDHVTLETLALAGFTAKQMPEAYAPNMERLSVLEKAEKKVYLEANAKFSGHITSISEYLGVSRQTVDANMDRYGIPRKKDEVKFIPKVEAKVNGITTLKVGVSDAKIERGLPPPT